MLLNQNIQFFSLGTNLCSFILVAQAQSGGNRMRIRTSNGLPFVDPYGCCFLLKANIASSSSKSCRLGKKNHFSCTCSSSSVGDCKLRWPPLQSVSEQSSCSTPYSSHKRRMNSQTPRSIRNHSCIIGFLAHGMHSNQEQATIRRWQPYIPSSHHILFKTM